ncbi:MAG: RecQ family ATP-dependent DNA helicase [Flavobacteriales bacterium]|nr:RecQ family ATP-dependent DNA helicase [Flavobacteriales bacterium]
MEGVRTSALDLLRRSVDDPAATFRDGQLEAITDLVEHRRRLLLVQRTGWGKSAVYFISARLLRDRGSGPTLLISPLLALMRNQLLAAERLGVRAATINSTNRSEEVAVKADLLAGNVDVLLISPERLANERFVNGILLPISERIGMLVVDEAHCISDHGHDFRPDYRRILSILKRLPPNLPVLATTATANDRVIHDLQAQLGRLEVRRGPLARSSLMLDALHLPDQAARLAWLAHYVPRLPGSGIIYTLTTRDAERVAQWLRSNGVEARAYHASITGEEEKDANSVRIALEKDLLAGELKALVATSALGMGFDKPDLGFVIHFQAPRSLIDYYQQAGRAGRAISKAYGVLLSGAEDEEIHRYFQDNAFPSEEDVQRILGLLEAGDGLSPYRIEQAINLRHGRIEHALKFLNLEDPAPVLHEDGVWKRTAVPFTLDEDRIQRITRQRRDEWARVLSYVGHDGCLMARLLEALDDPAPAPCGHCANCLGRHFRKERPATEIDKATSFLQHAEVELVCPVRTPPETLAELTEKGWILPQYRANVGRVLSRWGDAGWGHLVMEQKHKGHFSDELVEALLEMIRDRWKPDPSPQWVTCVPSLRHPELVPRLAQRLAVRLGLPFRDAVRKTRANEPQKSMQNRHHQCANLDGVFVMDTPLLEGPVLLVDDVADSGWTFAVVAAQLRQAGSGPVHPVALASTRHT